MIEEDLFFKKNIVFRFWKREYTFRVSQSLFSSFDIDIGTRFLLRTITDAGYTDIFKILDLGAGYGPLGITLSGFFPGSSVHMTERDAVAVDYAAQNAELNGVQNATVYGCLGYDAVSDTGFDMIVANIPGKAGPPVVRHLLLNGAHYLKPEGIVAVVVITPLKELIDTIFTETPGIEIIYRKERSDHAVFHYRFTSEFPFKEKQNSIENRVYDRAVTELKYKGIGLAIQTAYDVTKLDSPDPQEKLAIAAFDDVRKQEADTIVVYNPGQGYVPVIACKKFAPGEITLVDRDLLALEYSKLNLVANGYDPGSITCSHQALLDLERESDLYIIGLREETREVDARVVEQALSMLTENGLVIAYGSSTGITRVQKYLEDAKKASVYSRERSRGNSTLILGRPRGKGESGK